MLPVAVLLVMVQMVRSRPQQRCCVLHNPEEEREDTTVGKVEMEAAGRKERGHFRRKKCRRHGPAFSGGTPACNASY
jgi:hypothetical protein